MKIKIMFDFHDVFVNAHDAWIKALFEMSNQSEIIVDYENKVSKKIICEKYNINYEEVENLYRKYLVKDDSNIEFAYKLSEIYDIGLVSMSRKDRLLKDLEKFKLNFFSEIYAKEDVINREEFLQKFAQENDFVIFFNHEYDSIVKYDNLIYIPINFQGDITQFRNKSFTEHAKDKLLYNELSKYYMQAITNDTNAEIEFIKEIYHKYISKRKGTILDCCCGVGRHDYLLGMDGFSVTGIDISKSQIHTAETIHNNENVEYQVMDVRNINLNKKDYDMSICMWTTYNYLSLDEDLLKFIKSNYNHQRKDSILLLDSKNIPRLESRRVYKRNSFIENQMDMELLVNKFVKGNIQNSQYFYFIDENGSKKFLFDEEFVRFYSLDEITYLVKDYYEVINVYGDFDFSEYNEDTSERFIVVLRRK